MHASDTGTGTYDTDTNGVHLIVFKVVILAITQNSRDSDSVLKKLFFTSTQPPDPITLSPSPTHPLAQAAGLINSFYISSHSYSFIVMHKKRAEVSWNHPRRAASMPQGECVTTTRTYIHTDIHQHTHARTHTLSHTREHTHARSHKHTHARSHKHTHA